VSKTDLSDAMARLEHLSEARAQQVVSLIQDLAELEALENAADLKAARDALGEAEEPLPWEQVKARLDAIRFCSAGELRNSSAPWAMPALTGGCARPLIAWSKTLGPRAA
jgi:hypothetical protein